MNTRRLLLYVVVVLSVLIAASTLRAVVLGMEDGFDGMGHQILNMRTAFIFHIVAASLALALGAYQILPGYRNRYLKIHRWVGRIYATAVLLGGLSCLFMAFNVEKVMGAAGFAILAVLWLVSTTRAVLLARAHRIVEHRRWMIGSFALTFAAVSLRLQLGVFMFVFDMGYEEVDHILAWSCWLPTVIFALWYVRRFPNPPRGFPSV